MELSERFIQTLEKEGFADVFEWQDPAGKTYAEHTHTGKVTYMITDGAITFTLNGTEKLLQAGERFNVPAGVPHSMLVGPQGWIGIIGEEISGDA
jgi:quercetin dioxygenase-like cupin family protein